LGAPPDDFIAAVRGRLAPFEVHALRLPAWPAVPIAVVGQLIHTGIFRAIDTRDPFVSAV